MTNSSSESLSFDRSDELCAWDVSAEAWLLDSTNDKALDGIATSIIVFDTQDRILLLKRAASDSMPNKWEPPGGGVDKADITILHGAARELWEETGLQVRRFTHLIHKGPSTEPGVVFRNTAGTKRFRRFMFSAEVANFEDIRLDPNEHQAYVWAAEDEIKSSKIMDQDLILTEQTVTDLLLYAFCRRASMSGP